MRTVMALSDGLMSHRFIVSINEQEIGASEVNWMGLGYDDSKKRYVANSVLIKSSIFDDKSDTLFDILSKLDFGTFDIKIHFLKREGGRSDRYILLKNCKCQKYDISNFDAAENGIVTEEVEILPYYFHWKKDSN